MARRKQKGKELSMRKVREILRLAMVCGMGDREIARSCSVSHSTVGKYRSCVLAVGTKYSEIEGMDDSELMSILKVVKKEKEENRHQPDWEWVHTELRKKSVTMPLLWQEYKERSPAWGQVFNLAWGQVFNLDKG